MWEVDTKTSCEQDLLMEMDKMELWVMDRPPWECVLRIRLVGVENEPPQEQVLPTI